MSYELWINYLLINELLINGGAGGFAFFHFYELPRVLLFLSDATFRVAYTAPDIKKVVPHSFLITLIFWFAGEDPYSQEPAEKLG